ncbi:MAG: hypothetical protein CVU09_11405 [Bacteroidetes bacterium HGW-Bacteroidetes-4]|jgi:integrase|nr:MAG: hypothetical protein CVU09_11405 [Bacteroidetes bacterium HGW-Bacteroidetes-4]
MRFKQTPVDTIYLTPKELDAIRYKKLILNILKMCVMYSYSAALQGMAFSDVKSLKKEHISTDEDGITWIHKKNVQKQIK